MADSSKRQSAETVRSNYRQQLLKAGEGLALNAPTIVDKISDDADGLMPIGKINASLKVTIPLWPDRPPMKDRFNRLFLDWRVVKTPEDQFVEFYQEDIPGPATLPDDQFPLEKEIPLHVFENFEGKFEFRYRVRNWNTAIEADSDPAPVTIDRTGPIRPGIPEKIIVEKPLITTAILEADGGILCEVPDFDEHKKEFVTIAVALLDKPPTGELDPADLAFLGVLPLHRKISIPKEQVYKLGSRLQYIVYFLFDKAGNRSDMPFPTEVQVALGDLPANLQKAEVPLAADDLIDRADGAFPTTVRIKEYKNWLAEDGILIQWGKNNIARTPVGAHLPFPLDITVPWSHLKAEYDFDKGGVQATEVDYAVLRGDYPTASPGSIQVNVDLAIPGPENPEPEPINPVLGLVRFESASGSGTQLTPGDAGKPAKGHITLTAALLAGLLKDDVLTLYWNGVAVSSTPYKVMGDEVADQEVSMDIPWVDIEQTPVMDQLPMHYTLTRTGFNNPQESERTYIDVVVETVDLPEPAFPDLDPDFDLINCTSLIEKGGEWGIRVHIPSSRYLKAGVMVNTTWQTYRTDSVTPLPDTDFVELLEVSEQEERNGIDWFIPYDKCLKPTYDTGEQYGWGKAIYSINVRGTDIKSDLVEVLIAVFEAGGHCQLPRP